MIKFLCSQLFSANGWKFVNNLPQDVHSFVMLGAPHTSNWDFVPAMTVAQRVGGKACFVIKQEWLKFPMGLLLKPMENHHLVRDLQKQIAALYFYQNDRQQLRQ